MPNAAFRNEVSPERDSAWEILEILEERGNKYMVRWAGLDPCTDKPWDPSWVCKSDCNASILVEKWKSKKAEKKLSRRRLKRKATQNRQPKEAGHQKLKVGTACVGPLSEDDEWRMSPEHDNLHPVQYCEHIFKHVALQRDLSVLNHAHVCEARFISSDTEEDSLSHAPGPRSPLKQPPASQPANLHPDTDETESLYIALPATASTQLADVDSQSQVRKQEAAIHII